MSDNSTVTGLQPVGELPQRVAGGRLHPMLLVVPPPQFGRIRVTIAPLPPAGVSEDDPAVPAVVLLARVLAGLHRL